MRHTTMDNKDYSQKTKSSTMSITIIAIVAALALLGVIVVTVALTIPLQWQAEAAGCPGSTQAINASK
jgi:hypothetical protein